MQHVHSYLDGQHHSDLACCHALFTHVQGLKALFPKEGGRNAVDIFADDLNRLQPLEFLNDTVIDYYIRWVARLTGVGRAVQSVLLVFVGCAFPATMPICLPMIE